MPAPLTTKYPALDLPAAQQQVREALRRAVDACNRSPTQFTRRLNDELQRAGHRPISKQAVLWWMSEGTFVDRIYWEPIEKISDYAATRRQLRPDIYRERWSCASLS